MKYLVLFTLFISLSAQAHVNEISGSFGDSVVDSSQNHVNEIAGSFVNDQDYSDRSMASVEEQSLSAAVNEVTGSFAE